MTESPLPSYAFLIVAVVIMVNLATAWVMMLTMGENNGSLYSGGPPAVAALSCVLLLFCYYKVILPIDFSFWGAAFLAALGLWGAWVDYTHLSDRRKSVERAADARKKAS